MNLSHSLAARVAAVTLAALSLGAITGCAVGRDQSTVGEFIDDATITARVKAKFVEAKTVDAGAISVETLNGTVLLSGFGKDASEKSNAEALARGVKGVKSVDNRIVIRG